MKILLFKPGAIGDVIMTTPLVRQLRRAFPKAEIDYLVGHVAAPVLKHNKYLSKVIPFNEAIFYQKKYLDFLKLSAFIWRQKYQIIFILNKHKLYNLAAFIWRIPQRIGFDRLGEGIFLNYRVSYLGQKHHIFYNLDLLPGVKIKPDYQDIKLEVIFTFKEKIFAQKFYQKNNLIKQEVISVCPGGGVNVGGQEKIKRWPGNKYIELIKKLENQGLKVILIGGQQDQDVAKEILKKVDCSSAIGQTTLLQAAALLSLSRAVVCNDGGLMHLASAVNERIVSIFGPTNPLELAPLNKKSQSIFKSSVDCAPCYNLKGHFRHCPDQKCLKSITSQEVFNTLQSLLNN